MLYASDDVTVLWGCFSENACSFYLHKLWTVPRFQVNVAPRARCCGEGEASLCQEIPVNNPKKHKFCQASPRHGKRISKNLRIVKVTRHITKKKPV